MLLAFPCVCQRVVGVHFVPNFQQSKIIQVRTSDRAVRIFRVTIAPASMPTIEMLVPVCSEESSVSVHMTSLGVMIFREISSLRPLCSKIRLSSTASGAQGVRASSSALGMLVKHLCWAWRVRGCRPVDDGT